MIPIYIFNGCIEEKDKPYSYRSISIPALSLEDAKERLIAKYGPLSYCAITAEETDDEE